MGHSVKNKYNVKNKNKCPLPIFFVDTQDNITKIFATSSFYSILKYRLRNIIIRDVALHNVTTAKPMGTREIIATTKLNALSVVKTTPALTDNSPAKWEICTKEHPANFKGCPVFKDAFKKSS